MNLSYEQRLQVVARLILDEDSRPGDAPLYQEELGLRVTLKPHQVEGVSWLIRRYKLGVNVVLGDEMGLGKTLQAISFLSYLKVCRLSLGPFLVICPLSVTDGWVSEIVKFTPKLKVFKYVGDKECRRNLRMKIHEYVTGQSSTLNVLLPFDVLLTSYDIALMDQDFLSQISWQYAIIDEAQRLKNPSSVLFNVLKDCYIMPRRLLMTGTPIQNNLSELWALMYFCMPSVFGTPDQFLSMFKDISDLSPVHDTPKVKERLKILRSVLGAFMLRRTKSKLIECGNLVLPPLTVTTVLVPLVILQKKVYMSILRKELHKLLALSFGTSNHESLQNIVIQLRKACSHPYLFPGIESEPYEEGEHLVQASGKLLILDQLLQKLHYSGHRVLLFAQMTHTLDILQDFLELRKYSYERLDGSIRAEERFAAIRSFSSSSANMGLNSEADQNEAFVFIISTRAGGVGLNLVAADTVIFYEQDWNPQVDKQALQRAHRIGQMNHVLCINLVTERTVEEVIMRRAERKLLLSLNVIGDNILKDDNKEPSEVGSGDLKSIIFGLHMFDPTEINDGNHRNMNIPEICAMADRVLAMRDEQILDNDERKFEVNPTNILKGDAVKERDSASLSCDLGLDEASYLSWVKKFEEVSKSSCDSITDLRSRRNVDEEKSLKIESARKKAEEKKLARWEALGYQSLNVKDAISPTGNDIASASGSVHFVYGDCTAPSNVCSSEPAIIFSCVDTSGHWGHGGMFDALSKLSTSIGDAYQWASEHGDLHLGDLHLIRLDDCCGEQMDGNAPKMVALAVVQSYNPRHKIRRSEISLPHLESSLTKAAYSAAQNSASIHMPRIGYQDGSDRSEWYTIERLLRKYASIYNINIYVYYIKFRGLDADINFNLVDYEEDLKQMKNLSKEEFVHILRRHSSGFSRGSSKYRGVTLHKCGRWEARMGQFLGKKAYDKAAIKCNGREAVTNFEPSTYESEMKPEAINEGGSHDLDLSLGIATPGHGPKENRGHLQFQSIPYNMHPGRSSMMETNINSVIGDPSLKRLVVTEERPSVWNAAYSTFFPNLERAERMGTDPSKGVPNPNWAWQTHGQVTDTPVPPFSTAASSGFSISATFPSTAIFPTKSINSVPHSLCFTSPSTPGSNAPQFYNYYEVKSPQPPS